MAKLSVQYPDQAEAKPALGARILRGAWAVLCWAVAFGSVVVVSLIAAR